MLTSVGPLQQAAVVAVAEKFADMLKAERSVRDVAGATARL